MVVFGGVVVLFGEMAKSRSSGLQTPDSGANSGDLYLIRPVTKQDCDSRISQCRVRNIIFDDSKKRLAYRAAPTQKYPVEKQSIVFTRIENVVINSDIPGIWFLPITEYIICDCACYACKYHKKNTRIWQDHSTRRLLYNDCRQGYSNYRSTAKWAAFVFDEPDRRISIMQFRGRRKQSFPSFTGGR